MKNFKFAVIGVAALALTGCGGNTLSEAVPRADGMVVEDWHTFRSGCDVPVESLVQDSEGGVWVDKLAPACQDKGDAYIYSWGPFNPGIEIPLGEVENIKKVASPDKDQYREMKNVKVEG